MTNDHFTRHPDGSLRVTDAGLKAWGKQEREERDRCDRVLVVAHDDESVSLIGYREDGSELGRERIACRRGRFARGKFAYVNRDFSGWTMAGSLHL